MNKQTTNHIYYVVGCCLSMIAFGVVLYLWGERIFVILPPIARIGAYILTMLIPFAITRFPFCLFDHTFTGTVKKVKVQNEYVAVKGLAGSPRYNSRTLATFVYLTVELPDGTEKHYKAAQGGGFMEEYKPGQTVFHLYGAKHTLVLPEKAGDHVECPVCGDDNRAELDRCHSCGHTLIKSIHDLL